MYDLLAVVKDKQACQIKNTAHFDGREALLYRTMWLKMLVNMELYL